MKSTLKTLVILLTASLSFGLLIETAAAFTVACAPDKTSAAVNERVTWTSSIIGTSTGSLHYVWSGSDNLSDTGRTASIKYQTDGIKTANVTASTTTGETTSAQCGNSVQVQYQPVTGSCTVGITYISEEGVYVQRIRWSVSAAGGTGTYTYLWNGDATGTERTAVGKFNDAGGRSASVIVTSGSQNATFTCSTASSGIDLTATSTTPLGGSCTVSPSAPVINNSMSWRAEGTGGTTNYSYNWQNLGSAGSVASSTYTSPGPQSGTVSISDGQSSVTLMCQTIVASSTPQFGGGGCFIATAAYGSDFEPEVASLRKFRDEHLLTNTPGTLFVNAYYTVSPPIADFISDKEPLKAAVRISLEPIVFVIQHF